MSDFKWAMALLVAEIEEQGGIVICGGKVRKTYYDELRAELAELKKIAKRGKG